MHSVLYNKCIPSSTIQLETEFQEVRLSPNPAYNQLVINSEYADIELLSIYSQIGELVYTKRIELNEIEIQLDINQLNSGIYFLQVFRKNKYVENIKFIKN